MLHYHINRTTCRSHHWTTQAINITYRSYHCTTQNTNINRHHNTIYYTLQLPLSIKQSTAMPHPHHPTNHIVIPVTSSIYLLNLIAHISIPTTSPTYVRHFTVHINIPTSFIIATSSTNLHHIIIHINIPPKSS